MPERSNSPKIYNLTLTIADTEYSQALPIRTRKIQINSRNNNDVKISFTSGQSGSIYFTVKGGMTYFDADIFKNDGSLTIYAQCSVAAEILEVLVWVED